MAKRYVPPGARPKGTQGPTNQSEDSQRSLEDIDRNQEGGDVFIVKLRSDNTYSKNT